MWHCRLKRRPREGNIFHVLPLASAWGWTVDFNVSFLESFCLLFTCAYNPFISERNYPPSSISKNTFLCLLRIRCCKFCWLNILLFLRANYSQVYICLVDKGAMYIRVTLYCGHLIILTLFHFGICCTVFVLTLRWLMSYIYIYGAPILDVSRSHTTTQHSR